MKICIIGAGSVYSPEILDKVAQMPKELPVDELMLMDIDEYRLSVLYGFCCRYAKTLGFQGKLTRTTDLREAVKGSTFVVSQFRVGLNRARINDEKIPLSMGLIGQETTGAGGFMKGLRTIPKILEIARMVEEEAPDAWIINYTNPTGLVAEAVTRYTKANMAGLCSGGAFAQGWAAEALGVPPLSVRYDFSGLNHMNFSYNLTVGNRKITAEELRLAAQKIGSVDPELCVKLNALPSPYLQYYFHTSKKVAQLQAEPKTRGEVVLELEKEIYAILDDEATVTKPEILKKRGGGGYSEVAVSVMNALYNNVDTWAVVNVPNRGTLPFLPDDASIETGCIVNGAGIKPLMQAPPPKQVWGLIAAVKNYEQLAVEAAVTGDRDLAMEALLAHPLAGDYETVKELLPKLLEANRAYLPQFFPEG